MLSEAYTTRQFYGEKPGPGEALSLSVLIGPDFFMYAISVQQFRRVTELGHVSAMGAGHLSESIAEKLPSMVQNFFLHQKKFEKVNIAVLNRHFTMVPEAYGQEDLKPLLRFASGFSEVKTSLHHQFKGIQFCYTVEPELMSYLEKTFTNASIRHAGGVHLSLLFSQHALAGCDVFLNIGDAGMELSIKQKNEPLFYNVFACETNEDVLYYLLFTLEQFGLDPLQVKLAVATQRPLSDELLKNIKKYMKQVSYCVHDPSVILEGELQQLPQHYYFTLLNQHLCEL